MKWKYVQTENYRRLVEALMALQNLPPKHPCLGIVHGEAGRGKTEACNFYAKEKIARYLVASPTWSPTAMLCDVASVLKGHRPGSVRFGRSADAYRDALATMTADRLPLVVDEADRIVNQTKLMEILRDISDRSGVPVVFVGTSKALFGLQRQDVFASRLALVVEFEPLSVDEVNMATFELCGWELKAKEAKALHRESAGYFRDLVVLLSHLEKVIQANRGAEISSNMISATAAKALMRQAA